MPTGLFSRPGGDKPSQTIGQRRQLPFGSRYPPVTAPPPPAPSAPQDPYSPRTFWENAFNLWSPYSQASLTGMPPGTNFAPAAAPVTPYGATSPYLPTIMRQAPAWANADPFLRDLYTPMVGGASVGAQAQVGGALVDRSGAQRVGTLTSEGATTPGGKVEPKYATAPPNVDPAWYRQFQIEHGGEKPEDFYARTGEGLDEAVADRDWGNRFAQMMGRAPSEYDWEEHWYATRPPYRGRPQGDPGPGWRRKSKRGATEDEKRAPLYVPQQTSWRV